MLCTVVIQWTYIQSVGWSDGEGEDWPPTEKMNSLNCPRRIVLRQIVLLRIVLRRIVRLPRKQNRKWIKTDATANFSIQLQCFKAILVLNLSTLSWRVWILENVEKSDKIHSVLKTKIINKFSKYWQNLGTKCLLEPPLPMSGLQFVEYRTDDGDIRNTTRTKKFKVWKTHKKRIGIV